MIMKLNNFENNIFISDEYIRVLEIEDRKLFANIIHSINSLCYNGWGKEYLTITNENKEISFQKDVYFIFDILNINFNDRKILKKLYDSLKTSLFLDLEIKNNLENCLRDIFNILDSSLLEFPFEFTYEINPKVEELFKLYDIKLVNDGQTFMDKILYLIDLISLLDLYKVVIFCNLKSFFTAQQLEEIYKYIINNKLNVLLIEGFITEVSLKHEKRIRIDKYFEDYEI